jgi:apolipoprotein D and lipocalin family protein
MTRRLPKALSLVFLLAASPLFGGCAGSQAPPAVVAGVDFNRYAGVWYEIARFPNPFERDCFAARAEYRMRTDGRLDVENSCRRYSFDGPLRRIKGVAWAPDPAETARLKVRFFWPFSGDYWIVDLDDEYRTAVVSDRRRRYLWILNREPRLSQEKLAEIRSSLTERGFDLDRLIMTPQPDGGTGVQTSESSHVQ